VNSDPGLQRQQQYGVVNWVESKAKVEQRQRHNMTGVNGLHNVVVDGQQRRLCGMESAIRW